MLLRLAIWFLIAFGAMGCDAVPLDSQRPHARSPAYAVGFANRTSDDLTNVRAEWTEKGVTYTPAAGVLAAGAVKVFNDAADPIPGTATVIWRTADGREHRQKVEVAKIIPHISTWSGTVYFRIKSDAVDVVALTPKEERKLTEAGKEFP